MATLEINPTREYTNYRISVEQYVSFRERGFLVVKGLVPPEDVQALNDHMDDMRAGRVFNDDAVKIHGFGVKPDERHSAARMHMLHRVSEIHERFFLHPRMLDVLAALIGPDVLALQSMLFFKDPGQVGQGYHQDSYYIPTFPDTLCGAWLALTPATVANGCVWYAVGSQNEPVYPDPRGLGSALSTNIDDLGTIDNASSMDESANGLKRVVKKYAGQEAAALAEPGDVVFFGGHIVHWSYNNESDMPRRAYVGHYCNARSFVPWNAGEAFEGESGNYLHILARGSTHLPYAQPQFGTPCAANAPRPVGEANEARPKSIMGMEDGLLSAMPHVGGMDPD